MEVLWVLLFAYVVVFGGVMIAKQSKAREEERKIEAFREKDPDMWLRLKEMKHQKELMEHQKKMQAQQKSAAGLNAGMKVGGFILKRFLK